MGSNTLLHEIRRRNRDHLPALLAALERLQAGIRLTRADRDAVIDSLEDANASLALGEPRRLERDLAARLLALCEDIQRAEAACRCASES